MLKNVAPKSSFPASSAPTVRPFNAPSENAETESFGVQDIPSEAEPTQHKFVLIRDSAIVTNGNTMIVISLVFIE